MFCYTLRRRPSLTQLIPTLLSPGGLHLRESELVNHDISLPIPEPTSRLPTSLTGARVNPRTLRLLILTPSAMQQSNFSKTRERIQHFAALTGGCNIALIYLLTTGSHAASGQTAGADGSAHHPVWGGGKDGMQGYMILQREILLGETLPYIPILPVHGNDSFERTLKTYVNGLRNTSPQSQERATPIQDVVSLLRHTTTSPQPLRPYAASILTDIFSSVQDLVQATKTAAGKARLGDYLEEDEVEGLCEFWREEYVAE